MKWDGMARLNVSHPVFGRTHVGLGRRKIGNATRVLQVRYRG
jgi:hypothetical protein